jgi:hypothetical protein
MAPRERGSYNKSGGLQTKINRLKTNTPRQTMLATCPSFYGGYVRRGIPTFQGQYPPPTHLMQSNLCNQ